MFLSFWSEYLNFFIVLFSTIFVIVIVYLIYVWRTRSAVDPEEEFDGSKIRESFMEKTEDNMETQDIEGDDHDDIMIPEDLPEIITQFSDSREEDESSDEISSNLSNEANPPIIKEKKKETPAVVAESDSEKRKKPLNDFERLEKTLRDLDEGTDEDDKSDLDIAFESDDDEDKKTAKRYHVLYRKEDNKWYVKREGTDKITRVLVSQKEAIAFATIKAINQNTTVVVHKRDGKIRKYSL